MQDPAKMVIITFVSSNYQKISVNNYERTQIITLSSIFCDFDDHNVDEGDGSQTHVMPSVEQVEIGGTPTSAQIDGK